MLTGFFVLKTFSNHSIIHKKKGAKSRPFFDVNSRSRQCGYLFENQYGYGVSGRGFCYYSLTRKSPEMCVFHSFFFYLLKVIPRLSLLLLCLNRASFNPQILHRVCSCCLDRLKTDCNDGNNQYQTSRYNKYTRR